MMAFIEKKCILQKKVKNNYIDGTLLDLSRVPLIKHFKEKNRIVTVAFTKDKKNKCIAYGAVVFSKSYPTEAWDRSSHIKTATNRLKYFPVIIENFPYYDSIKDYKTTFHNNIRKCMYRFSTHNKSDNKKYDWEMPFLL
jgi:hypothetical protein